MDRKLPSSQVLPGVLHWSCCSEYRTQNTATGAFLMGSSQVFRDYLDLQCDFQYEAKPVYPKQKGEKRSRTALKNKTSISGGKRGYFQTGKKSLGKKMLVTLGKLWISLVNGFWWRTRKHMNTHADFLQLLNAHGDFKFTNVFSC